MADKTIEDALTVLCARARKAYKSEDPFKNQALAKDEAKRSLLAAIDEALTDLDNDFYTDTNTMERVRKDIHALFGDTK